MLTLAVHQTTLAAENIEELMAEADNIYNDHFMPSDRRELIETGVKLAGLKEDFAELKQMVQASGEAARRAVDKVAGENRVTIDKLEVRLRQLENFRWWIAGAAAAAGVAGSFLARFIH